MDSVQTAKQMVMRTRFRQVTGGFGSLAKGLDALARPGSPIK